MKLPLNTYHMPIHHPNSVHSDTQEYHVSVLMLITCITIYLPTFKT